MLSRWASHGYEVQYFVSAPSSFTLSWGEQDALVHVVFRRELFSIGIGGVGQRKSPFRIFHTTEAKTRPHDKRLVGYLCFYSKLDGWAENCMYELENRKLSSSGETEGLTLKISRHRLTDHEGTVFDLGFSKS
ncbi:hypothetical protein PNOK_0959800 [Pyrrhoderma noxium]|uniref:Uncharacterized protein n=1 Tax=Pyrrhoderma noxium TaxID=2282107 RepID=A0A286U642_9AGAM|nr:hypothetical protein PNOK_0959800 [Pyrrhoderma noxium]